MSKLFHKPVSHDAQILVDALYGHAGNRVGKTMLSVLEGCELDDLPLDDLVVISNYLAIREVTISEDLELYIHSRRTT